MQEENQVGAVAETQAAASTESAVKEKKPRKMKKLKREDFIVNAVKGGQRDAVVLATALAEAAGRGEISMKKTHKVAPTPLMWFLQVKWYFHQAKKKNLIDGDLIVPARERKPRKKKEATPVVTETKDASPADASAVVVPATEVQATTEAPAEETIGAL